MALPEFSMRSLLEAGAHFGHQTHRWNPKMGKYIFGSRSNIHIIDLSQSIPLLHQALLRLGYRLLPKPPVDPAEPYPPVGLSAGTGGALRRGIADILRQVMDTDSLYAPHGEPGRFFSPWRPFDTTLLDVLRWQISRRTRFDTTHVPSATTTRRRGAQVPSIVWVLPPRTRTKRSASAKASS